MKNRVKSLRIETEEEIAEHKKITDFFLRRANCQRPALYQSQIWLTRVYLDPILPKLESIVEGLRAKADVKIPKSFTEWQRDSRMVPNANHPYKYPIGYCEPINDFVFNRLHQLFIPEPWWATQLSRTMAKFFNEGGVFATNYSIVSVNGKRYFQNSMLLGTWVIDAALNTVQAQSFPGRKTMLFPVTERLYKPIDSFVDFADVTEEYQGMRVYPTKDYLPFLAPFIPIIALTSGGYLRMPIASSLFYYNILNDFKPSKEFLFESKYSSRKLPETYAANLRKAFRREKGMLQFFEAGEVPIRHVFKAIDSLFCGMTNGMSLASKRWLFENTELLTKYHPKFNDALYHYRNN